MLTGVIDRDLKDVSSNQKGVVKISPIILQETIIEVKTALQLWTNLSHDEGR